MSGTFKTPRVFLRKGRSAPFFNFHPWIFSGAIESISEVMPDGSVVEVYSDTGEFIGKGLFNSKSQISVRLFSWSKEDFFDEKFLKLKLEQAFQLRKSYLPETQARRMFYSESDGISGLIIDQYLDYLVVNIGSLGIYQKREMIFSVLQKILKPKGIYLRVDKAISALENIPTGFECVQGEEPAEELCIDENGVKYWIALGEGQKTSFYCDQRENRKALLPFIQGKRVLDVCCYTGGFGLMAAKNGASEVLSVDASNWALQMAQKNATLNGLSNMEFLESDMFEFLKKASQMDVKFDVIILDPPKMATQKKDLKAALLGYVKLNELALKSLNSNGILFTFSCSGLVDFSTFQGAVFEAVARSRRRAVQLHSSLHPVDHPISPHCPETAYLKGILIHVQ